MKFVEVPAGALQAIDVSALNPGESTLDEVILKNYEAHKDGSPKTVLNLSEAVAARVLELQPPAAVSTETSESAKPVETPVVPASQPVTAPVEAPAVETPVVPAPQPVTAPVEAPAVETVAPGPEASDPPADSKAEEKPKSNKK